MVDSIRNLSRRAAGLAAVAVFFVLNAHAQTPVNPRVKFQTTLGAFVLELQSDKAPKTVENFLRYVADKHYDGTIFHRVIDGFMVQGGGYTASMQHKPTRAPIPLEANNGLKNEVGTIAMARTAYANSATSEFFINVANNANLNAPLPDGYGYAVFGKVVVGMDVIDKIRQSPVTEHGGFQNLPITPISILSANLVK